MNMRTSKILYEGQKHSIYEIQQELGVRKTSPLLYNYANGKTDIKNMTAEVLIKIADFEKIGIRELYRKIKEHQETLK